MSTHTGCSMGGTIIKKPKKAYCNKCEHQKHCKNPNAMEKNNSCYCRWFEKRRVAKGGEVTVYFVDPETLKDK